VKGLTKIFQEVKECLKYLAQDLFLLYSPPFFSLSKEGLKRFPFPSEVPVILEVAETYFHDSSAYPVNPYALLLAVRASERGRKGFEFGVLTAKDTDLKTQCAEACRIIADTLRRFKNQAAERDFIAFLGSRYAPVGARNDPNNLNQHWVKNVRFYYEIFTAR